MVADDKTNQLVNEKAQIAVEQVNSYMESVYDRILVVETGAL